MSVYMLEKKNNYSYAKSKHQKKRGYGVKDNVMQLVMGLQGKERIKMKERKYTVKHVRERKENNLNEWRKRLYRDTWHLNRS